MYWCQRAAFLLFMLIFEFPPNLDTYIDGLTTITQLKFLFQYRYFAKRELWTQQTGPPIDVAETKKLGSIKHNSLVFHYFNFVSRKKKKKKKWIQISCFKKNTDLFPDERNKIQKAYKEIKKKKSHMLRNSGLSCLIDEFCPYCYLNLTDS